MSKTYYLNSNQELSVKDTRGLITGIISTESLNAYDFKVNLRAFADSIEQRKYSGVNGIKFLFNHNKEKVIGVVERIYTENNALKIDCRLNLELSLAEEIYSNLKMGVGAGFSVGFSVEDSQIDKGIKEVTQGDLFEVSLTYFPANTECSIEKVLHMEDKEHEILTRIDDGIVWLKKNAVIKSDFDNDRLISFDHNLVSKVEKLQSRLNTIEKLIREHHDHINSLKDAVSSFRTEAKKSNPKDEVVEEEQLNSLNVIAEFMKRG